MKKGFGEIIATIIYMVIAVLPVSMAFMGWLRLFTGAYHLFY
ncbi:MAG: hypothetical protein SPL13_06115 [Clostridia bacterium]|nr:hypothetical protein [Clostridia bacterium]